MAGTESQQHVIAAAERLAKELCALAPAAHGWQHVQRVRAMALRIAADEGADVFLVELGALLHEFGDTKVRGAQVSTEQDLAEWLHRMHISPSVAAHVKEIVFGVSYQGAQVPDVRVSIEGQCVRDADRLDAVGAIGIARAFTYGGAIGRPMHDPAVSPVFHTTADKYHEGSSSTVNHFREKLLLLSGRMETHTGRRLGTQRHKVMVEFLKEFLQEWNS